MQGRGEGVQSVDEGGCGCVEPLVGDAVDAAVLYGGEALPATLGDDAFERHAVAGSAPGEGENVGIGGGDGFRCGCSAGVAEEAPARELDQFPDPDLGVDEGLAPFFAVDERSVACVLRDEADGFALCTHRCDEGFGFGGGIDEIGEEANFIVDVGETFWREREDGAGGFEDCD